MEGEEAAAYKLSVRFEGNDNNATIQVTQTGFKSEENIQPHKQGWEQGLQQLQNYLSGNNTMTDNSFNSYNASGTNINIKDREEAAEEKYIPPVTGYNETAEQAKVGGA